MEKDAASSISTLERLDNIKMSLQLAKQGLQEADNWSVLANDVEEVYLSIHFNSKQQQKMNKILHLPK